MAKIKLGSAPKSFTQKVSFPLLKGGTGDVVMDFKYRDRAEFAQFIDEIYPGIKSPPTPSTEPGFDVVEQDRKTQADEVRYIMGCANGWDLEEDFTEANVKALVNEFPAAGSAIPAAYRMAISEGRVKN
ncbi:phage tail assembly chaperone [Rhodoferax sp. WC2427]|uniref:phage tail assembly chaperone n=1 Tax=Rhodoferax sp. WC2427 TaxID=3234144 RepID=UPI0034671AC5